MKPNVILLKAPTVINTRTILLFLIGVSLNFETVSIVLGSVDTSFSFILSTFYLISCVTLLPSIKRVIYKYKKSIIPVVIFLFFLSFANAFNTNPIDSHIFPMTLDSCFFLFIALLLNMKQNPRSIYAILYGFVLGAIILSVLFIMGIGVEVSPDMRMSMYGANENNLGIMMTIASSIIIYKLILYDDLRLKALRFILFFPLISILTLLFATASRSAFIVLMLTLILIVTMQKKYKFGKSLLILGMIITIVSSLQSLPDFDILYDRLMLTTSEGNTSGRTDIWKTLLPYAVEKPIFGVGETGYSVISRQVFYTDNIGGAGSPHNVLLEVFLYTGLVGFIPMIVFWSRLGIYSVKYYFKTKDLMPSLLYIPVVMQMMSGQILALKIVWVIYAFIVFSYYNPKVFSKLI